MKNKYSHKRPTGSRDEWVSCIDRVEIAAPPLERCASIHMQRDMQKRPIHIQRDTQKRPIYVQRDTQKRPIHVKEILTQETY